MTTPTPPPGWHPDPEGKPQLRWWDGTQWTSATQPRPQQTKHADVGPPPPAPVSPEARKLGNRIAIGVIALASVLFLGYSMFGDRGSQETSTASRETTSTTTATAASTTTTRIRPPAAYVPPVTRTTTPNITDSMDSANAPLFIGALKRIDFPNDYGNDYLYLQAIYVCSSLDEGKSFTATGVGLLETNPDWTPEQAGQLAGIAVGAFCNQHEGKIPGR
ncbi:hypothetical protein Mbo4_029 [Rhodococcus phage Mbo4]|uniref:DUF2510 domain-containing protein n=2 Tax=root TaxID=1 RepID=A0A9E7IEM4_9CAUD|nr:DUF2510 domain-containing protein [Rhodococcus opacus]YP_010755934.1 hypothetical protein QEH50_gp29 [Rhodococcus phage Mbo4]EKT83025.1 hypothetical protein WSS_A08917 [Rhodococcus opacus M213]URG17519.1 hypothetical protein Mbo4_029 [Rhodococcus phage Mbo4]